MIDYRPIPHTAHVMVAGANGMVGSAIVRQLNKRGMANLFTPSSKEVDFTNQQATETYLQQKRPDYLFIAAARVGGIAANSLYPAQFIRDNLAISTNLIHAAYTTGVQKLLYLVTNTSHTVQQASQAPTF